MTVADWIMIAVVVGSNLFSAGAIIGSTRMRFKSIDGRFKAIDKDIDQHDTRIRDLEKGSRIPVAGGARL